MDELLIAELVIGLLFAFIVFVVFCHKVYEMDEELEENEIQNTIAYMERHHIQSALAA